MAPPQPRMVIFKHNAVRGFKTAENGKADQNKGGVALKCSQEIRHGDDRPAGVGGGGALEHGFVQIHLDRQWPRLLAVVRWADGDSDHRVQRKGGRAIQVLQVLLIAINAQRLEESQSQTPGDRAWPGTEGAVAAERGTYHSRGLVCTR